MMKKFMKKLAIIIVGLTILVVGAYLGIMRSGQFGAFISSSDAVYSNADELAFMSTDIIRGVIVGERVERLNMLSTPPGGPNEEYLETRENYYQINTIHSIRISEVFMGDAQVGDIMEIAQLGGRLHFSELTNLSLIPFATGDDLVLFIRTFNNANGINRPGVLISSFQSAYRVTSSSGADFSNGIVAAYNANPRIADVVLENHDSGNSMVLTVGDLLLIRYEAGLGPRPYNYQLPVNVDRSRLSESISRFEYYFPQKYMLSGWDEVRELYEEAMRVHDNPHSRQIHVNPASRRLRDAMFRLGIDTAATVPPHSATITGLDTKSLQYSDAPTHIPGFRVSGFPHPTVTLDYNHGGLITWDSVVNRLYFAEGIAPGTHEIVLTASNGLGTDTHTFTLTVIGPATTPRPPATPRPSPSHPQEDDAGTESDSTSTPQPTTSPTPQPIPDSTFPTPSPEDTTEAEAAPIVLLRFEIGSLYYTNHEGEVLLGDAAPFITGNRAHVPLRIIAEALGAEVTWNRATRTGYMANGDTVVSIVVNQPLPDGMGMPVIINNRTMVPARYISETFGAEVRWDRDNAAVYVYMPR